MKFKKGDIIICIKKYSENIEIGDKFQILSDYGKDRCSSVPVNIIILRGRKEEKRVGGSLFCSSVEGYYKKENIQLELEF